MGIKTRDRSKQDTEDMKRENQLDATQWFIKLMIRSTCFGNYYAHHQELETIQTITACDTQPWL